MSTPSPSPSPSTNVVTSSQLFYNKLNEANPNLPHPLDETNISVAVPTTNNNEGIAKNSMVNITGLVGSPYSGTATAYYDRVPLSEIIDTVPNSTTFPLTTQVNISDCLTAFNNTFNVNMVASDIIDGVLPAPSATTGQIAFTLACSANSLAFSGSANLILQPTDISLTTFTTMNLNGMTVAYLNARAYTPDVQMVYSLVNADNTAITTRLLAPVNCNTTAPTALSGDASGLNTSVTITGINGFGFENQAIFKYNRQTLAEIIAASTTGNTTTTVPNTGQVTQQDMINSFNTAYGAKLTLADVETATIQTVGGGYEGITLTPVTGHYLFNGPASIQFLQSYPTLALAGGLTATASTSVAYSSSLAITGGDGIYQNAAVASGTLPAGLSVSIDGSNLVVSGTPTGTGTSTFKISVQSSDDQTVTSAVQSIAVTANVANVVTATNLNGLVLADVYQNTSETAIQALIARINNNNPSLPTPFTTSNVTLGTPTALTDDPSGLNTSVVLSGGSPYTGTVTIKYNRLDITNTVFAGIGTTPSLSYDVGYTDTDSLVAPLNTTYDLNLQDSDIVEASISPVAGSPVTVTMASGSYGFIGTMSVMMTAAPYIGWGGTSSSSVTLDETGYIATFAAHTSGYQGVWAAPSQVRTGKYYFELHVTQQGGSGSVVGPGLTNNGDSTITNQGHWYPSTATGYFGVASDSTTLASTKMWIRNNSSSWVNGDPVAGTSPTYTNTYADYDGTGVIPAYLCSGNNGTTTVVTLVTNPANFQYAMPSGYSAFSTLD